MRVYGSLIAATFSIFMLSGCYVETKNDDETNNTGRSLRAPGDEQECQVSRTSGCFTGEIASAPDITVEGQKFFDAETMREHFADLITIEPVNGQQLRPEDYSISVQTEFDNNSFARDFVVYVKGEVATNARVNSRGGFDVNRLPEGSYEVRLARPIVFEIKYRALANDPNNPDATTELSKKRCAMLYTEAFIDVEAGKVTREVFDSYKLHVDDKDCTASEISRRIRI